MGAATRKVCPGCGRTSESQGVVCTSCGKSTLGRGKRTLFSAIIFLLVLASIELSLRGYFAVHLGPSVFWYGTSFQRLAVTGPVEQSPYLRSLFQRRMRGSGDQFHNVRQHEFVATNYTKYHPNDERFTYDADTGEVYRATINSRGFRGPDPLDHKSPGTLRVVTLGASSTFGYHGPDDRTYPAILERVLNERCTDGPHYEVINLGIPHLDSTEITALFLAEALPLRPDIVTFYEGINDTLESEGHDASAVAKPPGPLKTAKRWARDHLVLAFLVHEVLSNRAARFDAAQVEAVTLGRPERFVENLSRLRDECADREILFVLGKQQARSLLVPREDIRGVTYGDEILRVREKLARDGFVGRMEMNFLIHERLIGAADRWARENDVPVADIVSALDQDRDVLVSWVHLSPRGNEMVAQAYAREILERTCPTSIATPEALQPPANPSS